MFTRTVGFAAVVLMFSAVAAHAVDTSKPARRYEVTEIVVPLNARCEPGFASFTFNRRMNESGQVVGYQECWEATGDPTAPFLRDFGTGYVWSAGAGAQSLPAVGGDARGTFARAINEAGTVVGWELPEGTLRALLWEPATGGLSYAFEPDACSTFQLANAEDINDSGSVAGRATRATPEGCGQRWVLKRSNGEEVLGPAGSVSAINNDEVMAGSRGASAIKWSPTLGEVVLGPGGVPGVTNAHAWNLNHRGQAVGHLRYLDSSGCLAPQDAVLWETDGTQRVLPTLPGHTYGTALGINERSLVVGRAEEYMCNTRFKPEHSRAVIWHKNRVTDLNTLLRRRDAQKIQLTSASAVTECGQIATFGFYRDEPLQKCPDFVFDATTGEDRYDPSLTCRPIRAFLLTPVE
jgi:uncharacterized membrane protein